MAIDEHEKEATTTLESAFSIRRAKNAVLAVVALRPLRRAIGAFALIVLVRNIDESDYGAYQIYYSLIGFLGTIASLGIANTLARYLPEYFQKGEYRLAHRMVRTARRLRLFSNALILTVIWLFWRSLSSFLNIEAYADSYFVFAAVALTFFQSSLLVTVFSSYLMQKQALLIQIFFPVVKVLGYLVVSEHGLDASTALGVDLIAYVLLFIGLTLVYRKHVPTAGGRIAFSHDEAKRVLRYGFFYNFNDMGQFAVGNRIDNFFIASIMDVASVGAYALANRVLDIIRGFVPDTFFFDVIRPLFFTLNHNEDAARVTLYFQLLVKSSYIFLMPATAVVILAHSEIFDVVFGGKFLEYSALLAWVFVFATLTAFDRPLRLVVQLREKAAIVLIGKSIGIYNVVALLLLIPRFGVVGAAIATGSANIFQKIFLWWFVREHASFSGMGRFFLISLGFWTGYCVITSFAITFIDASFWRLSIVLVGAVFSWLLYLRMPLLSYTELATIAKTLRRRHRVWLVRLGLLPHDLLSIRQIG